ncbi:MAG: glycoside hydrolase family 2 protein [Blautia sp.]|nr:glycoside hydrolase family 2 protein [Lachnoclostridium sp.]MCM1210027.1 glycoside hydrolase family 2 protein [Blautia sp.]
MTERIYLNNDWKFTQQYSDAMLAPDFDDSGLASVRLPHTCKETPFHYFDEHLYQMVSGYRRTFDAPQTWRGQKILLTIDGAAHESEVFLNGKKVGVHHCGYTAFTMDLSENLHYGAENTLVVKVDSREELDIPPFGFVVDYMTYGGIYRDVFLDIKNPVYLEDVFIHSELEKGRSASLISQITLNEKAGKNLCIRQSMKRKQAPDTEYCLLGETWTDTAKAYIYELQHRVGNIRLWNTKRPNLYEIKTELLDGDTVLDTQIVTFGFRKAEFRADGFYLNGRKIKIRGLNRHQSFPYVGYAMPESMQKRDADILKEELGVNAVRTSHYPQSHYFLDRCDEIGLLVFTEMPGWQHIGGEAWKQQAIENVRDMVKQYRNHTSIILWGVRINESLDDDDFYQRTNAAAHALDPFRATGGVRANKRSSLLEDVYTYNDFLHDGKARGCEKKSNVTSNNDRAYLISEYNGHMYPSKAYDWEEHRVEHAIRHANVLNAVAGERDIAGSFGWCMFDYNTHKDFGSGDRICYHGVMDMFRNPKLAADIYACAQEEKTVLSISSSMDIGEHPGCNRGNTYIFTNADSVRMYKNGRFIKEYTRKDSPYKHLKHGPILIDDFIGDAIEKNEDFKPAQAEAIKSALNATARYGLSNLPKSVYLTAVKMMAVYHMKPEEAVVLYNRYIGDWGGESTSYRFEAVKNGEVVKTVIKEPITSLHLHAEADHYDLIEKNTYDVAAVRISVGDEHGNQMPFYNEPVRLEADGPVEIIGPDVISLQGGMGGTFIRTTGSAGKACLRIWTQQTEKVELAFRVR